MATLAKEMSPMFQRMENARTEFIASVVEQFGSTEAEAEHVLRVFRAAKVAKLDVAMGRYELRHGAFWEADVIARAIATELKS